MSFSIFLPQCINSAKSLTWFWRQYWNSSTHMSEGTIWFSTFCIVFTIWMNKQTFFSKFTIGEGSIKQKVLLVTLIFSEHYLTFVEGLLTLIPHNCLFEKYSNKKKRKPVFQMGQILK